MRTKSVFGQWSCPFKVSQQLEPNLLCVTYSRLRNLKSYFLTISCASSSWCLCSYCPLFLGCIKLHNFHLSIFLSWKLYCSVGWGESSTTYFITLASPSYQNLTKKQHKKKLDIKLTQMHSSKFKYSHSTLHASWTKRALIPAMI